MKRTLFSRGRLPVVLTALAVLGGLSPARAQRPVPQLSCQLYNAALIGFSPYEEADAIPCVAGAVPKGWPKALTLEAPVRALGGAGIGPIRAALFEFPRSVSIPATMDRLAKEAGLSRLDNPQQSITGFVKHPDASRGAMVFCGTSGAASSSVTDSTATSRLMFLLWTPDRESMDACRTSQPREFTPPLVIPELTAPAGVKLTPGGTGSSNDRIESTARLDTAYTAEQLLVHYARQLRAAGWTVSPSSARSEGIAIRQLAAKDKKGEQWRGVLMILTAAREREVTLKMVRDSRDEY
jgi:hypothetical protein